MDILFGEEAWKSLKTAGAPNVPEAGLTRTVSDIIAAVRARGDDALREFAARFGDDVPEQLAVSAAELRAAVASVPAETRALLDRAAANVRAFAEAVVQSSSPVCIKRNGLKLGLELRPVQSVGCYVPGGRFPLPSTALMTALTARVAGVERVCIVTPRPVPELLTAGILSGVEEFYRIGGAQAIAALAFGTETVPGVDMVVGPGNAFVTEAKRQLQGVIGIDLLAGPSEVVVLADASASARLAALELLAQLEHEPEARAWLLTDSETLAREVAGQLEALQSELELPGFVTRSAGRILVLAGLEECVAAANELAPEHLVLQVAEPQALKRKLFHYGALFLGSSVTVPFGDYMAGPNHTLPTGRTARFAGGLSPLAFLRPQSWLEAEGEVGGIAADTAEFAVMEGLVAHAAAARARIRAQ